LAQRAASRLAKSAQRRGHHGKAHQQENRREISRETRFYITSLAADPAAILKATRAHWRIENNLHWQLDVTFDEDRCRTRNDFSPLNFAVNRHMAFNILKRNDSKLSLKRKRLKASINADFRARLLAS
jgi:predicted transposase YbfD/YdcC